MQNSNTETTYENPKSATSSSSHADAVVVMPSISLWSLSYYRKSWMLLLMLQSLRLLCCFLPGYIHPDEFFQGGQEIFFGGGGCGSEHKTVSWEFEPEHAVRSIIPPSFATWFPLMLYANIMKRDHIQNVTGKEILIVPRLFLCLLSFLTFDLMTWWMVVRTNNNNNNNRTEDDDAVVDTATRNRKGVPVEVLIMASSWTVLIFGCRPFSNTLEAMVLSCLLTMISISIKSNGGYTRSHYKMVSFLVGMTSAIGFFTRFTFAFFAAPSILMFLHDKGGINHHHTTTTTADDAKWNSKINNTHKSRWNYYISNVFSAAAYISCGFLLVASAILLADVRFYRNSKANLLTTTPSLQEILSTITPMNALLYNSKVDNLMHHGLHSRVNHALINMPMLFGPLYILFFFSLIPSPPMPLLNVFSQSGVDSPTKSKTFILCQRVVSMGLLILSCAPHQEPRFVLPMIIPLVVMHGRNIANSRRWTLVWVVFNVTLAFFFGGLHQAGVVPSLLQILKLHTNPKGPLSSSSPLPVTIYFHTYMPPAFLVQDGRKNGLHVDIPSNECKTRSSMDTTTTPDEETEDRCRTNQRSTCDTTTTTTILDLQGSDMQTLQNKIQHYLQCSSSISSEEEKIDKTTQARRLQQNDPMISSSVHVVSPPFISSEEEGAIDIFASLQQDFSCRNLWSYWPHITTEDFPPWITNNNGWFGYIQSFELVMYEIKCRSNS